jgi:hypothetical protein
MRLINSSPHVLASQILLTSLACRSLAAPLPNPTAFVGQMMQNDENALVHHTAGTALVYGAVLLGPMLLGIGV